MHIIKGATHTGLRRSANQDTYGSEILSQDFCYMYVCDGLGGENGGEVASALASEAVKKQIKNSYRNEMSEKSIYLMLETTISAANSDIYTKSGEQIETLRGMATTCVLGVLHGSACFVANVGDSRMYLKRGGTLTQLTVDHTRVQMLLDSGEIQPEEAHNHPDKNALVRAVGASISVKPDFFRVELQAGDILLACSDGLYGMVDSHKIADLLEEIRSGANCDILIDAANEMGGVDNITAVVLVYDESGVAVDGR